MRLWTKSHCVTIQMKPLWQYFCMVSFIIQNYTIWNLRLLLNFDVLKGLINWRTLLKNRSMKDWFIYLHWQDESLIACSFIFRSVLKSATIKTFSEWFLAILVNSFFKMFLPTPTAITLTSCCIENEGTLYQKELTIFLI